MVATNKLELEMIRKGRLLVCGIDEVGRGSLAGPLVAASVVLPRKFSLEVDDSKKISKKRRDGLAEKIKQEAVSWGLGWVTNNEIDLFGITESVRLAYFRALEDMQSGFSIAIIDGNYDYLDGYDVSEVLIKADAKVACVAAASIIAKVSRDDFMMSQKDIFDGYDFENNVGYGTKKHIDGLNSRGLCSLHRRSFCAKYL